MNNGAAITVTAWEFGSGIVPTLRTGINHYTASGSQAGVDNPFGLSWATSHTGPC